MLDIEKKLIENRPNLSKSSVKTYTSILMNLYSSVYGDNEITLKNFNNTNKIIKYLDDKEPNVRKTILSSLFVLTDNPIYKDHMLKDIEKYNDEIKLQQKTSTQKENWLESEKLNEKINSYEKLSKMAYKHIMNDDKKNVFYQTIQDYIILCLLGGKYIPPRRAKDYTEFKIKNISVNDDNYIKGNNLYFNKYKGSESKGTQILNIPIGLKKILTKWIKINPTEYLLFDSKFNKLSNITLNQRLNKIFNGKISINALRHTYLTDKHKDTLKDMDKLDEDLKKMGSSMLQAKTYIKNN
jgi:hypothetical protein